MYVRPSASAIVLCVAVYLRVWPVAGHAAAQFLYGPRKVHLGGPICSTVLSTDVAALKVRVRMQFGGGKSTGFGLIYDDLEALKRFEPDYRKVRPPNSFALRPTESLR